MAAAGRALRAAAARAALRRPHLAWLRYPRSWEAWAYIALVAAALATRLWDLGARSLNYDEVLHAWYSWRYAEGMGYAHTPLTHGPFLFHAGAATFSLIGSSDYLARLVPALFGAALVGLPYFLRSELGRRGALAVSGLLLISPTLLYFGRFMRNDIYMAVWALALLVVVFRYRERPRTSLLFAWAVLWAFAFATKESAYLLAGTFGLFLLASAGPALWEWARNERRLSRVGPAGDLFIVLATLSLPLFAPITGLAQGVLGIVLVNPDANDPRVQAGELARAAAETGAPVGGGLYIAAFIALVCVGLAVAVGTLWDRRRWPLLAAAFTAVWLPLFTSMFTNWQGFFTGFWGSLGYWMAQQGVERANQPLYYYVLGLSTYEFLVLVPAVLGGAYLVLRPRSSFDVFIVAWAALTFGLFTFAGERMPWLLVGITLPLAVVAGRTIGMLADAALKSPRSAARAFAFGALVSAVGVSVVVGFLVYEGGLVPGAPTAPLPALVALGALTGLLAAAGLTARLRGRGGERAPAGSLLAAMTLGALAVAAIATVAVAARASYSHAGFERPRELLVYSQTGQETSYAAECMERLAEASGLGENGLRILVDDSDNFGWQWRWYLRDYGAVTHQSLHETPLDASSGAADRFDVAMMSESVERTNAAGLDGFQLVGRLRHLWWFPNYAYNKLTLAEVASGARSREGWRTALDYAIAREFGGPMQWSKGVIYVRDELAPQAAGCSSLRASPPEE